MKLRVGDKVEVIAGKDKGKQGEIVQVLRDANKVIVEGINMVTKHVKPSNANPEGSIITSEAPLHASNVAIVDSKTKSITKVKYDVVDGKKVRVAKKSGTVLDKTKKSKSKKK